MRSRYWSCTRLADKIRGTAKPQALGWTEWDTWHEGAKQAHPLRYWIAETFLDKLQAAVYYVPDRIHDLVYWSNCRFVFRRHQVTAHPRDIKPGTWAGLWDRMFYAGFNELVNLVERDLAKENVRWDDKAAKQFGAPKGLFRWPYTARWRSRECGLQYLDWEIGLGSESPQQSKAAKEIKELYLWWTEVRPLRKDPHDISGWSDWVEKHKPLSKAFKDDVRDQECKDIFDKLHGLEALYDEEDMQQFQRLVRLRWGLNK